MAARDSIRFSDSFTKMKWRLNAFAPDAARPDTCNRAIIQRPREFESDRIPSRQLFLSNRSRKGIWIPVSRASCNRVPRLLFRRLANPLSRRRRNRWQAAQRGSAVKPPPRGKLCTQRTRHHGATAGRRALLSARGVDSFVPTPFLRYFLRPFPLHRGTERSGILGWE